MRITKINAQSDTNFKGLTIDQRALYKLNKQSAEVRVAINKAGEELTSVNDYVLALDENLGIKSIHKIGEKDCNYWTRLMCQMNRAGKYYERVSYDGGGETVDSGYYPKIPPILTNLWGKSANNKEQYEQFKQMDGLSQATTLTKLLSKRNSEQIAAKLIKTMEQLKTQPQNEEEQKRIALEESEKIIAKYGVKPEEKPIQEPVKKTFWDKIKGILKSN